MKLVNISDSITTVTAIGIPFSNFIDQFRSRSSHKIMSGKTIETFCRVGPVANDTDRKLKYETQIQEGGRQQYQALELTKPNHYVKADDKHKKRVDSYGFTKIFDQDAAQEDVFESVGMPVIKNVLKGYNGTIFAYGQTGTGKTYTILGKSVSDPEMEERGLIPRAIEYIFEALNSRKERNSSSKDTVQVTYMEIYKEAGFDLLNGTRKIIENRIVSTLREVQCKMDSRRVKLINLSEHLVESEEQAMDIFLDGTENRAVAETYANEESSRSHCIFSIKLHLENEDNVTESQLNLVDLAGSERVSKNHLKNRSLVTEAKSINLSLLFLHKVIKAITTGRKHVPFRDSMLTRILRDSLTGNCMTSLIATISPEEINFDETSTTCKFAQNVSKLRTQPILNKSEDLAALVAKLQLENERLQREIEMNKDRPSIEHRSVSTDTDEEELTEEEKTRLRALVLQYYEDNKDATLDIDGVTERIQYCFDQLKGMAKNNARPMTPKDELSQEEMEMLERQITAFLSQETQTLEYKNDSRYIEFSFARFRSLIREIHTPQLSSKKRKGTCC